MAGVRIHIGHHFFGAGNLGDDLMMAGFLEAARPWADEITLSCCTPHDIASQRRRFPSVEWLPYEDAVRRCRIEECDVWLGLGDTPFQAVDGNPWFLDHLVGEAAWCRQFAKPMYYLGVGVNEREVLALPQMSLLLGQAEHLWLRDAHSADLLRKATDPAKLSVCADLAHIALQPMRFPPTEAGAVALLLNFEDPRQFELGQIAGLIDPGKSVRWLVQEVRPLPGSESDLYARLPEAARARLQWRSPEYGAGETAAALLAPWGSPETLFTSRYHGALIGAWMGARTVAFHRSDKLAGAARALGLPLVSDLSDAAAIRQALADATPVAPEITRGLAALARASCEDFLALVGKTRLQSKAAVNAHSPPELRDSAVASHLAPYAALASVAELESAPFRGLMTKVNAFASEFGLRTFTDWSKVWEYPWLWFHGLQGLDWRGRRLLDLGSEISPFPWLLACLGARVTLIETDPQWRPKWEELRARLGVDVDWRLVDSEILPLDSASVDAVTSFSVVEHQPDKVAAIAEIGRVLRPGGLLAISYDICEPSMGMTFPAWNGRALTLREFEEIVWRSPAFDAGEPPAWNLGDAPEFRRWHLQSAPHHQYIVGAAVLERRGEPPA